MGTVVMRRGSGDTGQILRAVTFRTLSPPRKRDAFVDRRNLVSPRLFGGFAVVLRLHSSSGMSAEPLLMEYFRELAAHGWVQVPTTRETGPIIFVRGTHLLDRIKVVRHRWSHQLFDGASWQEMARGDDAASLAKYITENFRSRGR